MYSGGEANLIVLLELSVGDCSIRVSLSVAVLLEFPNFYQGSCLNGSYTTGPSV